MKRFISSLIIAVLTFAPSLTFAASADAELELKLKCPEGQTCPEPEKLEGKLRLKTPFKKDDQFIIEVTLKNPGQQNITSVQSWLNYDATKLEGISIEPTNRFDLVAPGEKDFDSENNRVKIGLASTTGGVNEQELTIASLTFKVLTGGKGLTEISFYDYQVSELGHTNANIIEDNFPVNILAKAPDSLEIPLNEAVPTEPVGGPPIVEKPEVIAVPIERPAGVTLSTGHQYGYLNWQPVSDIRVVGYHIYYGTKSGYYMHRKNVGNVNAFYITDLQNDIRYYFAITAFDAQGNESDYSDETAVIINHPATSTSPMIAIPRDLKRAETGPTSMLIIITALIAGTIGIVFAMPKRKKLVIRNR